MIHTPQLGLNVWNLTSDKFITQQLAANWQKVEQHDHTSGKGNPITTGAISDGAVTTAKLASGLDPTGAYTTYRSLFERNVQINNVTSASGPYPLGPGSVSFASSTAVDLRSLFNLDAADFQVTGRTTYLRIKCILIQNNTASPVNFTVGLYPIGLNVTSGSGTQATAAVTTSGLVTGSTVAFTTPAVGSTLQASGDFAIPATAGWYVLAVALSGNTTASTYTTILADLQMRQV